MNKFFSKISKNEQAKVLFFYLLLTLVLTYPLALSLDSKFPGWGDAYSNLAGTWWYKHAIFDLGKNPFQSDYLSYPHTLDFGSINNGLLPIITTIPFQFFFGHVAAYNLVFILSFVVAGLGAYLLVEHLTKNKEAAIIGGAVFAFSPYHLGHGLGHFFLANLQWMPFFALFLLKTFEEKKFNWKNPAIAGVFFAANALSDWTYMVYMGLFAAAYALFALISRQHKLNKDFFKKTAAITLISFLLISPFLYLVVSGTISGATKGASIQKQIEQSADLLGFFIPTELNSVLIETTRKKIVENFPLYYVKTSSDWASFSSYIGYSVLILAVIGALSTRKTLFWVITGVFSFLMALGPILSVNTIPVLINQKVVILPYKVFSELPFASLLSAPVRFDVLLTLALAVLVGFGVSALCKHLKKTIKRKRAISIVLSFLMFLIFIEYFSAPYPLSSAQVPQFYHQISKSGGNEVLLEFPALTEELPEYNYYQSVHKKKLLWGYLQHHVNNFKLRAFIEESPVLSRFTKTEKAAVLQIASKNEVETAKSILSYYNVTYVVFHKKFVHNKKYYWYFYQPLGKISNKSYHETLEYVKELEGKAVFEDKDIIAFKMPKSDKPFITPFFGDNWQYAIQTKKHKRLKPLEHNATLEVLSTFEKARQATLNLTLLPVCSEKNCTPNLNVTFNGKKTGVFLLKSNSTMQNFKVENLIVPPGESIVEFSTNEKMLFKKIAFEYK
ncbi:MAG: hypothetical protein ACE5DI_02485 [Candidatus Micrarchaeia archaeon]